MPEGDVVLDAVTEPDAVALAEARSVSVPVGLPDAGGDTERDGVAGGLDEFLAAACGEGAGASASQGVKYAYGSLQDYPAVAHRFGYIDDAKAGVPRTAYGGVVTFVHQGCRKFAVPGSSAAV